MPRGYHGPPDPDKGKPYRHQRQKIALLLSLPEPTAQQLLQIVMLIAEKRPGDVLDAALMVLGDGT
jgi:hypothetical protein